MNDEQLKEVFEGVFNPLIETIKAQQKQIDDLQTQQQQQQQQLADNEISPDMKRLIEARGVEYSPQKKQAEPLADNQISPMMQTYLSNRKKQKV